MQHLFTEFKLNVFGLSMKSIDTLNLKNYSKKYSAHNFLPAGLTEFPGLNILCSTDYDIRYFKIWTHFSSQEATTIRSSVKLETRLLESKKPTPPSMTSPALSADSPMPMTMLSFLWLRRLVLVRITMRLSTVSPP